ncbi:Carbon catabolite repressor protein 4 homolog (Partial), partial [Seminavis robusta]
NNAGDIPKQNKKKHLLVMMAHLHHNPVDDVIKYAEMSQLLNSVACIRQTIRTNSNNEDDVFTIVVGDFNAQPTNQVYRLAVMGGTPTLSSLQEETMVLPAWLEQRQAWLPLYQQIYQQTTMVGTLDSVYSVYNEKGGECGHPRYTNLTDGFKNNIDYILYDKSKLCPIRLLELDVATYEKEDYLPSQFHASDHVPLWAEFECR